MKKLSNILLLLMLVFTMVGCNEEITKKDDPMEQTSTAEEMGTSENVEEDRDTESVSIDTALLPDSAKSEDKDASLKEESGNKEDSSEKPDSKATDSQSQSSEQTGTNSNSQPSSTQSQSGGQSESQSKSNSKSSSSENKSSGQSQSGSSKSETSNTKNKSNKESPKNNDVSDPNMITVTVSIDVKTAHAKGYVNYEYILGSTKVQIDKGSSAWDALNKVTKNNNISVVKRDSGDSLYVSHINSIGEFDFGESYSGWTYNVNGVYPNYGADNSRSVLKDGDVVQWRYTLDYGKDVGSF